MSKKTSFGIVTLLGLGAAASAGLGQLHAGPAVLVAKSRVLVRKPAAVTLTGAALAKLSPAFKTSIPALVNDTDSAGVAIISFNTATGLPGVAGLDTPVTGLLARTGVVPAARMESLGIITAVLTKAQVAALAAEPQVVSIWNNYRLHYDLHQARVLCGVDRLRADATMTMRNGGKVVDGSQTLNQDGTTLAATAAQTNKPGFSVVVIDSGIDTTGNPAVATPDLQFTPSFSVLNASGNAYVIPPTIPSSKIIQNVQVVGDDATGTVTYTENAASANNDSVGHGTHCAGIVGGTGAYSKTMGEDFSGVASGAKIIGCGSGAGLFVLDALGGMNYSLNFQSFYNVRITSNSYGSDGAYDPTDPLSMAIANLYTHDIITVFAAGNSGPGVDTIGIQAKSPYVISVAAGTKEGGLASFSSRGKPAGERAAGSVDAFNLPAITAPGTGREFAFDGPNNPATTLPANINGVDPNPNTVGKKFYSDIISTRSKSGSAASGTNDQEFPAGFMPNYTMISGTSMACPFVAGTCALLLDADPTLKPDSLSAGANGRKGIKEILQATATHLPDYQDYEVGAGYLNAYAAVDLAFNPTKPYAPFNRIDATYRSAYAPFITQVSNGNLASPGRPTGYPPGQVTEGSATAHDEDFILTYNTNSVAAADYNGAKTKAATGQNAYAFLVDANPDGSLKTGLLPSQKTTVIDARIQFGNDPAGLQAGNTLGLLLWAPDGTMYSSGIALPVEDSATRQAVVKNPVPGLWVAELRGLRGLAAVPITPPTGVALPDTVYGQIYRTNNAVTNPPTDSGSIPQSADINFALTNHYLDQKSAGLFQPSGTVTRADFAQVLADNTPLRQSLASVSAAYTDAAGATARYAEAAAQNGSTLRDWDFTPGPTLTTNGGVNPQFSPNLFVSRMQVATAMVRAVGLDAEAKHLAGTVVRVPYKDGMILVTDAYLLTPSARGYLQLALNRGFISSVLQFDSATQTYTALANPNKNITRADLAAVLVKFRLLFPLGNSLSAAELTPQS